MNTVKATIRVSPSTTPTQLTNEHCEGNNQSITVNNTNTNTPMNTVKATIRLSSSTIPTQLTNEHCEGNDQSIIINNTNTTHQ